MNEELQRAVTAGVVEQTQGGHRCRVCDKDVAEILPHLRGKDHQNNLVWEALSNPAPHPFLLEALPSVVREAKQRGELEVVDKTVFSYRCRVCTKKSVVNGITPLETHLNGNDHKRAARMLAASPVSPPDPRIHPSSFQPPQVPTSTRPDVQPYQPFSLQQQRCPPTYNQQLQYPSFDHPHKTPSPLPPTQSPAYYPTTLQPRLHSPHVSDSQPPASSVPHTSAVGLGQPPATSVTYSFIAGAPQPNAPLPAAVPFEVMGYDPELQHALTAQVVEEVPREGGPPSFKCRACDKDFNGSAPCLEHLRSKNHKKKAQAWTLQRQTPTLPPQTPAQQTQTWIPQPETPTLQPQRPTLQPPDIGGPLEDGWASRIFDALPIIGSGNDRVDGSFRWRVVTGTPAFQPSDIVYRNLSMPRGLVLIFNYYFTGQGEHERHGAKRDSFNLKTLFEHMGYRVYLYEDCTKSRTEEALTSTQNNPVLRNLDSFIVFIMSHGKDDQIFYTASGREDDCMKLDDVRYKFTDTECPALSGKPKLFFINFCRATREQVAYDGMAPQKPQPEDMLTVYSCINSFKSPRDPQNGTFFVQAWCEVLAEHAHNKDLHYLHTRADQLLKKMGGSVQELQNYSFKFFYFNPVHTQ